MIVTCMDCLAIKLLAAIELTEQVVIWQFVYGIMCLSERLDLSSSTDDFETVFIEFEKGNQQNARNVLIGVIYRAPNQNILLFNEKLNNIMNDVRMENEICYFLGDYNINILNYASYVHIAQFVDMMSSSGFLPLITRPTRVTATSAILIDNIFTNCLEDISHSIQGLFITAVSDHFQIFHVSRGMQMSDVDTHICRRLYFLGNKEEFCHDISTTNWDEINRATDTQQAFDLFHNRLTELYNRRFPKVQIKKKYNNRKPWLSEGLKNSIRHKNELYVKSKKIRSVLNDELYKTYQRKL